MRKTAPEMCATSQNNKLNAPQKFKSLSRSFHFSHFFRLLHSNSFVFCLWRMHQKCNAKKRNTRRGKIILAWFRFHVWTYVTACRAIKSSYAPQSNNECRCIFFCLRFKIVIITYAPLAEEQFLKIWT